RPPVYPGPGVTKRQPTMSGHFHHAGWVVNNHGDPGRIADPWAIAPPKPAPTESTKPEWETPEHIRAVQQLLNDVTDAGLVVDGIRGPATEAAVRTFQADYGHNLDVDGSPGPLTRTALEADMSAITDLTAKVDALSTVTLNDSQKAALVTGQSVWDTARLLAILTHRIGWTFQRTADTRDTLNALAPAVTEAVVSAVAGLPGLDAEAVRQKVKDAVESITATVTLTVPDEEN